MQRMHHFRLRCFNTCTFLCVDFRTSSLWAPVIIVTRAIFTVAKSVNIASKFKDITVELSLVFGRQLFLIGTFETDVKVLLICVCFLP